MRIGLTGCGKVAHLHAAALATLPNLKLAAVHDALPQRAQEFAERYRAKACETLEELLREVDALFICTPHPLHRTAALLAAEARVHVLVEKPLASKLADCDAMIEACSQAGVKLGVISQRRFYEPVQRMRQAIDEGKLGAPILGTMQMLSWRDEAYYRSDPWRGTWAGEGGGVLVNQSPHQLDILLWLMGPLAEVSAYWGNQNHPYIEVEDTAVAALQFRNGALGSIITSVSQKPGVYTKVHVHGANGASVGVQTDTGATFVAGMSGVAAPPINDLWTIPGEEHRLALFQKADADRFTSLDATWHYHALQFADFASAIEQNREPSVTGADGRAVVALIDAIYRSGREHKPVSL
jgi:UDP-N-acetyl-2-amino-2-deoxyglucuronate dehydrogenase